MTAPPSTFVYNPNSKVLHRLPASEACNTDQILRRRRFQDEAAVLAALPQGFIRCRRCFPDAR